MTVDVSIVIVNWNSAEYLESCLKSIYAMTKRVNYEIIVVDNNSSDNSVDLVKNNFRDAVLIESNTNAGYGAGNNSGIRIAKGKYVFILNPDTILVNNAIFILYSFLENHPEAGLVGGKILNSDGSLQVECIKTFPSLETKLWELLYLYRLFPKNRFFGKHLRTYDDKNCLEEIDVHSGESLLIRKKALNDIGLFDENLFMYADDVDVCMRLKQCGWKIYYQPRAEIIHFNGGSSRKDPIRTGTEVFVSDLYFFRKYHGKIAYCAFFVLTIVQIASRLVFFSVMRIVKPSNKTVKQRIQIYIASLTRLLPIAIR